MLNTSRATFAISSVFVLVSALSGACAHPQSVTLTSATAAAPPPAVPQAAAVAVEADEAEEAAASDAGKPPADEAPLAAKPKKSDEPMTFQQLSAALGSEDKIGLEMTQTTEAPARKGLSANGYAAVGAAHQAVDSSSGTRAGDIKVSGGISAGAVRSAVREGASRLRACYEHGLLANPRLAGRVTVSFSVDEHGAVSNVDTESDAIPSDVMSCVKDVFSSMTFAPPKAPPAKIVYPVDFNKDS